MYQTCGTCKHWTRRYDKPINFGKCRSGGFVYDDYIAFGIISEDVDDHNLYYGDAKEGHKAGFLTGQNFGCIHYECVEPPTLPKPEIPPVSALLADPSTLIPSVTIELLRPPITYRLVDEEWVKEHRNIEVKTAQHHCAWFKRYSKQNRWEIIKRLVSTCIYGLKDRILAERERCLILLPPNALMIEYVSEDNMLDESRDKLVFTVRYIEEPDVSTTRPD